MFEQVLWIELSLMSLFFKTILFFVKYFKKEIYLCHIGIF